MFTENILGIVNVHRRIRLDSSMQGVGMLGNDNVRRKNARNRQYKVGKCSELWMQGERMLEIIDVHRKNTQNRQ